MIRQVDKEIYYGIIEADNGFGQIATYLYITDKDEWDEDREQSDWTDDLTRDILFDDCDFGEDMENVWSPHAKYRVLEKGQQEKVPADKDAVWQEIKQKAEKMGLIYNEEFENMIKKRRME